MESLLLARETDDGLDVWLADELAAYAFADSHSVKSKQLALASQPIDVSQTASWMRVSSADVRCGRNKNWIANQIRPTQMLLFIQQSIFIHRSLNLMNSVRWNEGQNS